MKEEIISKLGLVDSTAADGLGVDEGVKVYKDKKGFRFAKCDLTGHAIENGRVQVMNKSGEARYIEESFLETKTVDEIYNELERK